MRRTAWVGVTLALLSGWRAGAAEEPTVLYSATVVLNEAEVRSGAGNSNQLYPTNRLRKGDRVEVVRDVEGGWLAIKPPPGSFSWINSRFVRASNGNPTHYIVVAHPDTRVPLLLGSHLRTDKPTVEGARVVRGTLLRSIGPQRLSDDGYWLPVEPPPGEVRYIRAEAVSKKAVETTAAAPPGTPEPPAGTSPAAGPPGFNNPDPAAPPGSPAPAATAGPHPLWQRAQQAETAGQYQEAIRLYQQLSSEVAASNHALAVQASNRAQHLTDALAGRPAYRGTETASKSSPAPTPAGLASSGPGWLRRAGRTLDYNTLYVLENSRGLPILYATAQPGYSLDVYANRNVELLGTRQYRSDLRAYHMVVMQIKPLQ